MKYTIICLNIQQTYNFFQIKMSYQFVLSIEASIDEKIQKNKSSVLFQNEEILKTKASLLELQKCLINQNEALKIVRDLFI